MYLLKIFTRPTHVLDGWGHFDPRCINALGPETWIQNNSWAESNGIIH